MKPALDVTIHRFGREEHVLRLGDDVQTAADEETRPQTELEFFAALIRMNGGNPDEILRAAAARLTKDDKSRRATWLLAEEVRPEIERLIREEPTKKKAVLLARIAERRGMKYETLRDILARASKSKPQPIHYVRDPDPEQRARFMAVIDKAEEVAAEEEQRRGAPPQSSPFRSSPVRSHVGDEKGARDERRRTSPPDDARSALPLGRPRHDEEVADTGRRPALRKNFREPLPLLARGAEEVDGRTHAPKHRRPGPRPGRVRRKRRD